MHARKEQLCDYKAPKIEGYLDDGVVGVNQNSFHKAIQLFYKHLFQCTKAFEVKLHF